jgi:predicted TPR repeat methyltransferase
MKNKSGTNNPAELLSRAAALHQGGQLEAAEPLYRAVLAHQSDNGDALHLLGVLRYQQRDPEAAVPLIEAALRIIPDNIFAWVGLGLALLRLHRFDAALESFDRALAIKPDYAEALTRRGDALRGLGRQAEALASYNRSLRYRPNDVETLNSRAARLIELGRPTEALASLDQALVQAPGYLEALHNRATALIALKRNAEALTCCAQALTLQPEAAELLNNRGVALRNLNRKAEAIAAFRAALASQPDSADFHANLGITLQETSQLEAAAESLRRALAAKPSAASFQALANVLYEARQFDAAAEVYRQWLEFEPDNPIPQHMTAAGRQAIPERASDRYVAGIFDTFAETFDSTLLALGYRTPQLLTSMLRAELGTDNTPLRILDAGCGTGLAAPLLRPLASRLVGVDLSGGMLDRARQLGLYDELALGELCRFMNSRPGTFDVIVLADTLVYFGALETAFGAAHSALGPHGILVFALESHPDETDSPAYKLELHGRYSHRPDYVRNVLTACGFQPCTIESVVLRREHDTDVSGIAIVARRNAD